MLKRGYALVLFNPNDCAEDTTLRNMDGSWAFRNTRFFPAYPGYDWGILAGWAWGASRVADYLEHDASIDASKLIITGASRNGKSSMIAAAFDDRLMGAPVVTGGGGVGAYRFAGPRGSETLDIMQKKYPNWFSPNLHQFWGQREKLPFDQHWFLALAAPRPFIALEGDTDRISLPEAVRQSILGARPAYALLGAQDRLGVNFARHGHAFTADDWTAMLDFFDKHLRGKPTDRTFDRFPTEQELDSALAAAQGVAIIMSRRGFVVRLAVAGVVFLLPPALDAQSDSGGVLAPAVDSARQLPRIYSLLVSQRGVVILERYFNGRRETTPVNVKSVSKSIISALVGIAADRKLLALDQPVSKYFPDLPEAKRTITIEHLLTCDRGSNPQAVAITDRWVQSSNWVRHALARPL